MSQGDNDLKYVGFRAESWLDDEIEDLAWDHRMNKSELLREICKYGVENIDQVVDESSGSGDDQAEA